MKVNVAGVDMLISLCRQLMKVLKLRCQLHVVGGVSHEGMIELVLIVGCLGPDSSLLCGKDE